MRKLEGVQRLVGLGIECLAIAFPKVCCGLRCAGVTCLRWDKLVLNVPAQWWVIGFKGSVTGQS